MKKLLSVFLLIAIFFTLSSCAAPTHTIEYVYITAPPTKAPTKAPASIKTKSPVVALTKQPTAAPEKTPTLKPVYASVRTATPKPAATKKPAARTYVLNTNTKKFHYPSCPSVDQMKSKNKKVVTEKREKIMRDGYTPCKRCNP